MIPVEITFNSCRFCKLLRHLLIIFIPVFDRCKPGYLFKDRSERLGITISYIKHHFIDILATAFKAVEGIRQLGYPDYFRIMLTVFKVIGAIVLILPIVPARIKEWAYAGFGIAFISAAVSHTVVDGVGFRTFFPVIILAILVVSYISYQKLTSKTK